MESESCSVMSDSLRTHGVYSAWNSPGQNTGVGSVSLLQGIRSPTLQVDSLPAEPQGKPKNTGMDNLSLLQQIFQTQESNQGLLQCRWILCQLSYQGSPPRALACITFPKEKSLLLSYTENPWLSYFQHKLYQCITFPTSRGYTINVK